MSADRLNDAMPARQLLARWVLVGQAKLETAAHLGSEANERVDMPVLRDTLSGQPLLPGTTLAGALRNALADYLGGYRSAEALEVADLFGGQRADDLGVQSPLIVFDAIGALPEGLGVETRDGVAIDPSTGIAEHRKKYEYEVLPAGTTFDIRCDLLVPDYGIGEHALVSLWATALEAFFSDGHLGARRSRGLGRLAASGWNAVRYPLDAQIGWLHWAKSDHRNPVRISHSDSIPPRAVLQRHLPAGQPELTLPNDHRKRLQLDLHLHPQEDVLIRSPGDDPSAPEVVHLSSGGQAVLPGTSVAGAMRSRALRIARIVRTAEGDADAWVDRLFGPRFIGQRPPPDFTLQASPLQVGEAPILEASPRHQTRIAVDRFTQAPVDTALFEEQTSQGGQVRLRLTLKEPDLATTGLLLLVVRDLLDGSLPVGGAANVGRGWFTGAGELTWSIGNGETPPRMHLNPVEPLAPKAAQHIDEAIAAFGNAPPLTCAEPSTTTAEPSE